MAWYDYGTREGNPHWQDSNIMLGLSFKLYLFYFNYTESSCLFNQKTNGPVMRYIPINLFDQNGKIHVYNTRAGSEQPLESIPQVLPFK